MSDAAAEVYAIMAFCVAIWRTIVTFDRDDVTLDQLATVGRAMWFGLAWPLVLAVAFMVAPIVAAGDWIGRRSMRR